jgi:hypothetical protein
MFELANLREEITVDHGVPNHLPQTTDDQTVPARMALSLTTGTSS